MKTEERKKEDCELLDRLLNRFDSMQNYRMVGIIDEFHEFKADNDLLPNRELSKEEWYERIGIDKHIEAITKQGYLVTLEKK